MLNNFFEYFQTFPEWWLKAMKYTVVSVGAAPFVWLMCGFAYDSPGGLNLQRDFFVAVFASYPIWLNVLTAFVWLVYRLVKNKYIALSVYLLPIPLAWAGSYYIDHAKLPSNLCHSDDPRIYYYTPARDIAEAIMNDDTLTIRKIAKASPRLVNYVEAYHKQPLLFFAYDNKKYASVRELIRNGVNPNTFDPVDGECLLHKLTAADEREYTHGTKLISEDALALFGWLLKNGADVNAKVIKTVEWSRGGFTPIQCLCEDGVDSQEMARMLIDNGANLNVKRWDDYYKKDFSLLADAFRSVNLNVAIELLQNGVERDSLAFEMFEESGVGEDYRSRRILMLLRGKSK